MDSFDLRGGLEKRRPSFFAKEELPRGARPRIILGHVKNTVPFVFDLPDYPGVPQIKILKDRNLDPDAEIDHAVQVVRAFNTELCKTSSGSKFRERARITVSKRIR